MDQQPGKGSKSLKLLVSIAAGALMIVVGMATLSEASPALAYGEVLERVQIAFKTADVAQAKDVAAATAPANEPSRMEHTNAIKVVASVKASRLLVIDDQGRISQIYSNTSDHSARLHVRNGSSSGEVAQMDSKVMEQYQKLQNSINWSKFGLVYEAPATVSK